MKATIERGKCETAYAVTMIRPTEMMKADVGASRRRFSIALAPLGTPCPYPRGSPAAAPRPSSPLAHDFAEEALGPEDQDEDQDREGEDVLVLRAEGPAGEERQIGGGEGLEQAQHEPAQHGAGDVADAAQHRGGEGLEAGDEPGVGVDQAVLQ